MISNPDDKNSRIADPVSDSVPSEYSCWCMQKDNRLGKRCNHPFQIEIVTPSVN